jgi:hypothetical protein
MNLTRERSHDPEKFGTHDTVKQGRQSVTGHPPPLDDGERQSRRHSCFERLGALMSCLVPPVVQMSQVRHLLRTRRVGGLQVQQKSEAVEVPLDIIVGWVAFLKCQLRGELRLSRCSESGRDGRDPDLRAFRVKIAAKTLKVGAEVQYEPAKSLVEECRVRRSQAKTAAQCASTSVKRGMRSVCQRVRAAEGTWRPRSGRA